MLKVKLLSLDPSNFSNLFFLLSYKVSCQPLYQVHVSDEMHDTEGFMTTIVSPLADQRKKIFSMDCEMVIFHFWLLAENFSV